MRIEDKLLVIWWSFAGSFMVLWFIGSIIAIYYVYIKVF